MVTYIAYKATDPASLAQLEAQLVQEYLIALVSALCVNICPDLARAFKHP